MTNKTVNGDEGLEHKINNILRRYQSSPVYRKPSSTTKEIISLIRQHDSKPAADKDASIEPTSNKTTKTTIPDHATSVRNAATGEETCLDSKLVGSEREDKL